MVSSRARVRRGVEIDEPQWVAPAPLELAGRVGARRMTWRRRVVYGVSLAFVGILGAQGAWHAWTAPEWRTASREPVGLAPDPATVTEAVVQVYAARAWGWRGYFGVHSWVAVKPSGAPAFIVYEVIGWRLRWGGTALTIHERAADARWFGRAPELLADVRGEGVNELIERIDRAARTYPHADRYRVWPGPNSNTFTAFLGRAVPELGLDLPPTAIGKDYVEGALVSASPGGGVQASLYGLAGVLAGTAEGIEANLLGMVFGVHVWPPAIKLPIIGRVGWSRGGPRTLS